MTPPRFESGALLGGDGASDVPGPAPRTLRVPVGTLYLAAAAALLGLVAAYLYGVSVGERVQRERLAQQRADEMNAAANLPAVDPLKAGRLPPSLAGESSRDQGPGAASDGGGGVSDGSGDLGPTSGKDPRQSGFNYFVLAHTTIRNGQAMVDFCRKNGLDAHLVPDDNGQLRLVIVLPGFAAGERNSPPVQALKKKIDAVGLKWKNSARGNRDFGDAYPSKFVR